MAARQDQPPNAPQQEPVTPVRGKKRDGACGGDNVDGEGLGVILLTAYLFVIPANGGSLFFPETRTRDVPCRSLLAGALASRQMKWWAKHVLMDGVYLEFGDLFLMSNLHGIKLFLMSYAQGVVLSKHNTLKSLHVCGCPARAFLGLGQSDSTLRVPISSQAPGVSEKTSYIGYSFLTPGSFFRPTGS